jgi:hypothetical protein
MKWHSCLPALVAIGLGAAEPAQAQGPKDDYRRALIQTLRLAKTERASIKRLSAAVPQTAAQLAPCLDRLATDERLEAELMPVIARSVPTPDHARPILAFLATSAGRKFSAAVERRDPEFKPALWRPVILPGVVPMSTNELTTDEAREIGDFFRSDQGAPLLALLKDTGGFAQLTRALTLRKTFAAECGIDVK